jgi:hypothetical protein
MSQKLENELQKVIDDSKAKVEGLNAELKRLRLEDDRDMKTTPSGPPAALLEARKARAKRILAIPSELTYAEIANTQARIELLKLLEAKLTPGVDAAAEVLAVAEAEFNAAEEKLKLARAAFKDVSVQRGALEGSRFRAMGELNDLNDRYRQELNHLSRQAGA